MYDYQERGIEFPVTSDWDEEAETSSIITFRCPPDCESVFPPITGAEAHLAESRSNYQFQVSTASEIKALEDDESIVEGISTGWVLSVPERTKLEISEGIVANSSAVMHNIIRDNRSFPLPTSEGTPTVVILRFPWSPEVDDGYSLLVTNDHISDELGQQITVLSHFIDADCVENFIDIPVLFHEYGTYTLMQGDPIVQIIPIPRRVLSAETRYHPPADEE